MVKSLNILGDNCVKESAFVKQNLSQIQHVMSLLQGDINQASFHTQHCVPLEERIAPKNEFYEFKA